MPVSTILAPLIGGVLIGTSALLLLWLGGRIAGVSGIVGGLLAAPRNDRGWRVAFLAGLGLGGAVRPSRILTTSLARLDEAGGGLNYYFLRHALKLQLDYIHTWGPALPLGRGDQFRLQLQLAF